MPLVPDPIAAVTAADPTRVYADLAARGAMIWHDERQAFIATRGGSIRAVLDHPACLVRPASQPVPTALVGTAAGDIFGRFVRMTDGQDHRWAKDAIGAVLAAVDRDEVGRLTRHWTDRLHASRADRLAFDVPVHVVGAMLGIPDDRLALVSAWTRRFADGIAPHAPAEAIAGAVSVADDLRAACSSLVNTTGAGTLARKLRDAFTAAGPTDQDDVVANLVGLLIQAHDATAGLIANTVAHLVAHPSVIDTGAPIPAQVMPVVELVSRGDPSIQNTRRFVSADVAIEGTSIPAGSQVVVLLAAGDDDPASACPFGHGRHACPGQEMACAIATACVETLIAAGALPDTLPSPLSFLPRANARIPILPGLTGPRQ